MPTTAPTTQPGRTDAIKQMFADLAHRDAPVREKARFSLMGLTREELPILRQIVQESRPLHPSQAVQLREIVTQAFLAGLPYERGPTGFLGVLPVDVVVSIPNEDGADEERPAVAISEPIPGFSGYRFLLEGDIVLAIKAGNVTTKVRNNREMIFAVSQRPPGETIEMRLIRKGSFITVSVRLDAAPLEAKTRDDLEQFMTPRREAADEHWRRQFGPLLPADPL